MISDLFQLSSNPTDYEHVYKKSSSDIYWRLEIVIKDAITILYCLVTIALSIKRLLSPQKWVRLITNGLYILLILTLVIGYYKWSLNGFDHP